MIALKIKKVNNLEDVVGGIDSGLWRGGFLMTGYQYFLLKETKLEC